MMTKGLAAGSIGPSAGANDPIASHQNRALTLTQKLRALSLLL